MTNLDMIEDPAVNAKLDRLARQVRRRHPQDFGVAEPVAVPVVAAAVEFDPWDPECMAEDLERAMERRERW